jgi:diaminopimelate epimerase
VPSDAKVRYLRSMDAGEQIEFQKWEGTGNTFVMIYGRNVKSLRGIQELGNEVIQAVCDREKTDGLIVLSHSNNPEVDLHCDFRNPDGSRSFCGNGTRAAFAYARREGWVGDEAVFEACDGLHRVRWSVELDLPSVEFESVEMPDEVDGGWFVDTGSPHHIQIVANEEELQAIDIVKVGADIRYSERYAPDGANVSALCSMENVGDLGLRTYERGVEDETRACGTGAVAAALVDYTRNGGDKKRKVNMPGGELFVDFETGKNFVRIWLSGKASEMRRGRTLLGMLALLLLPFFSIAQTPWHKSLSNRTEVSIITASPGEDVYSLFGHTAIRIYDPEQLPDMDWVFNYGTFSFSEDFYLNFMKGRLEYKLTAEPFYNFHQSYLHSGRGMFAQRLDLTPEQVRDVAEYLAWNIRTENSTYSYEFFRDNCASRVINVLSGALGESFETNCEADGRTYRDGLRPYIEGSPWTEFGMDFILGPKADQVMEDCGAAFIPDDLSEALILMTVDDRPITKRADREEILISTTTWIVGASSGCNVPLVLFSALALLIFTLRWRCGDEHLITKVVRKSMLIGAGLLGVLLVLMWGVTDHTDTWQNWNLVWTIPAVISFFAPTYKKVCAYVIAGFLLISPFAGLQFLSPTLWVVALSVFLTVTHKIRLDIR